jgi:hypothetical protein
MMMLTAGFGIALDFLVGAGVMIHSGLTVFQYNGPTYYVRRWG